MRVRVSILALGCGVLASLAGAQPATLAPEWDASTMLAELAAEVSRLKPLLSRVDPALWVQKGGSPAYPKQHKAVSDQMEYVVRGASELAREPDKLGLALELYFRLEVFELTLNSVIEAVRRYENSAVADLIQATFGGAATRRDQLREYLQDLAAARDSERKVMDQEAQRCRADLSRRPLRVPKKAGSR